jgi:hypothetical protein
MTDPLIRDVSDTARWMAVYRARETDRADAVFRDPFARALAGERGERIAAALPFFEEHAWSVLARTHLFDRFVTRLVQSGVEHARDLAIAGQADLCVAPGRVEHQDVLLTGLRPRLNGRQFGHGDQEEDDERPQRSAPRSRPGTAGVRHEKRTCSAKARLPIVAALNC